MRWPNRFGSKFRAQVGDAADSSMEELLEELLEELDEDSGVASCSIWLHFCRRLRSLSACFLALFPVILQVRRCHIVRNDGLPENSNLSVFINSSPVEFRAHHHDDET